MINPNDLVKGQCYFLVGFYDRGLKYPRITTVFYIGQNIFNKDGGDKWYFQDAEKYLSGVVPKNMSDAEELGVLTVSKDALPLIESLGSLIQTLNDVKEDKLRFKHKV